MGFMFSIFINIYFWVCWRHVFWVFWMFFFMSVNVFPGFWFYCGHFLWISLTWAGTIACSSDTSYICFEKKETWDLKPLLTWCPPFSMRKGNTLYWSLNFELFVIFKIREYCFIDFRQNFFNSFFGDMWKNSKYQASICLQFLKSMGRWRVVCITFEAQCKVSK